MIPISIICRMRISSLFMSILSENVQQSLRVFFLRRCASDRGVPKIFRRVEMPSRFILIEGIDGSGKSTLAEYITEAMKERFTYCPSATLSIVGQPYSKLPGGVQAKRFVESADTSPGFEVTAQFVHENRTAHERYLEQFGGTIFCIRGLFTDMATFHRLFGTIPEDLGARKIIDRLIVVDVEPTLAYSRILSRGVPPTWRESMDNLEFFRRFYYERNHPLVRRKEVVSMYSLVEMRTYADTLCNELYFEALEEAH
jgi:thymidylate kinase